MYLIDASHVVKHLQYNSVHIGVQNVTLLIYSFFFHLQLVVNNNISFIILVGFPWREQSPQKIFDKLKKNIYIYEIYDCFKSVVNVSCFDVHIAILKINLIFVILFFSYSFYELLLKLRSNLKLNVKLERLIQRIFFFLEL